MPKRKSKDYVDPPKPARVGRGAGNENERSSSASWLSSRSSKESSEGKDRDYLRQYQYKKVDGVPTIGGEKSDPDKGSKAETMKQALMGQKRVSTLIPADPGSDSKVPYSVTLNGYRLDLPVNTYIDVPEQVAEVVRQSNNQTIAAVNQFRADDSKKKEALEG